MNLRIGFSPGCETQKRLSIPRHRVKVYAPHCRCGNQLLNEWPFTREIPMPK
jgi:hypothetical protein